MFCSILLVIVLVDTPVVILVNELVIAEPKFIIQTKLINGVQGQRYEFQSLNCETALEISIQISIIQRRNGNQ